jgi:hypothetical protein
MDEAIGPRTKWQVSTTGYVGTVGPANIVVSTLLSINLADGCSLVSVAMYGGPLYFDLR